MADEDYHPYHHGDLRRTLLRATLELIDAYGINGFSMREVARQSGVSHSAPYKHFADKATLLAALMDDGFKQFTAALRRAYTEAEGNVRAKFEAMGLAYVQFALAHPSLFRLMFRPELLVPKAPPGAPSSAKPFEEEAEGFRIMVDALVACQEAGFVRPGEPRLLALTAWSLMHGVTTLMLDGAAAGLLAEIGSSEQIARLVITQFEQGVFLPAEKVDEQ